MNPIAISRHATAVSSAATTAFASQVGGVVMDIRIALTDQTSATVLSSAVRKTDFSVLKDL